MSTTPVSSPSSSSDQLIAAAVNTTNGGSTRVSRRRPAPTQTIATDAADLAAATVSTIATSVDKAAQNQLSNSKSSSSRKKRSAGPSSSSSSSSSLPKPVAAASTPANSSQLLSMLASAPQQANPPLQLLNTAPDQDLLDLVSGFPAPGGFPAPSSSFPFSKPTSYPVQSLKTESTSSKSKKKAVSDSDSDSDSSSSSSSSDSSKSSSSSSSSSSSDSSKSSSSSSSSSSSGSSKSSSSSSSSGSESSSVEEKPLKGKKAAQEKAALDARYAKYTAPNEHLKSLVISEVQSIAAQSSDYIQPDLASTMQAAFLSLDREVTKAQIDLFGGRMFVIQATFKGAVPKDLGVFVKEGKGKWSERLVVKLSANRASQSATLVFAVKNGLQVTDGKKPHVVEVKFAIPKGSKSNATRNDIAQANKPFKFDLCEAGFMVSGSVPEIKF